MYISNHHVICFAARGIVGVLMLAGRGVGRGEFDQT